MDIFDLLTMIGGLCLFLFGMNIMGEALERRAGGGLRTLLGKMTGSKLAGFLTGAGITAIIQSSSATTVMVVGFVNSGLLALNQAVNVIMGANVGTTITSWLLSLSGIDSSAVWVKLLKPSSFTPVLALIGVVYYMFLKDSKKKDTGMILLGFATLMFGMDTMSGAVAGLKSVPGFADLFLLFTTPVLGVLAGLILTAILQSSSASVGILQALAASGSVTYGAAIPIVMGQNIGTCVTALISSVGATRNAKRAAGVHLAFNIIGTAVCLVLYCIVMWVFAPAILNESATMYGIAILHSAFNIFCTVILLPASSLLEKLVVKLIPDSKQKEVVVELDERLLSTPPLALAQSRLLMVDMAYYALDAAKSAIDVVAKDPTRMEKAIREEEDQIDHYEDILSTYLLKLSSLQALGEADSEEVTGFLKLVGDFERIGDHAVNILGSAKELAEKNLTFTEAGQKEMDTLREAVKESMDMAFGSFLEEDMKATERLEPLRHVIHNLQNTLRTNHIQRMTKGLCSVEAGFVWADLLTNLGRVTDHCSNIAGCVMDMKKHHLNLHESQRESRNEEYRETLNEYTKKYAV